MISLIVGTLTLINCPPESFIGIKGRLKPEEIFSAYKKYGIEKRVELMKGRSQKTIYGYLERLR